ncbi:hypothetical protein [Rugamonas rubra]|uniref:Uncharacterized protein n=1 Tax=Rugamonas rubra TaxID=758825 RepID=A0A1I4SIM2_9BURK|nr:hypothetical protein [Rugamonas rubra]SFM64336.1 hypothetical protein SAMN02982985_04801 [Rugamonas rubra]
MKKPTAALLPDQQALTMQEQTLLLAYRTMDGRRQCELMSFATGVAEAFPRRAAPTLRLISAAGTAVRP